MIEFLLFFVGILLFSLDVTIIPTLSSYVIFTDLTLFYCFRLYEIKKERSLPFFIFILLLKAILVPEDILLPFIVLYLASFLLFIGILHATKMANILTIGLPGLFFFSIEYLLFHKPNFSMLLSSLFVQYLLWLCLMPVISSLSVLYQERIKGKGVFV